VTGFWFFVKIPSVTMTDSASEDDGSEEGSRHEEESEYGDDDVEVVQASGSRASAKPILRLPERNGEDTAWTRADGTRSATVKNKFKSEDMARVGQRKELMWKEVSKNDATSLLDRWLRDQIKPERWDKVVSVFPQ